MSPEYERNLKEELWACFKNIGFSMDELMRMPRRDRRMYIQLHNKDAAARSEASTRDLEKSMQPSAALGRRAR